MSLLTGLKAVTTRTRSLRQVVTTRRIRSRCVDPRFKCRSSPATTSMPRSNGSLRITSSASSGVTRWRQVPGIRVIPIELDLGTHSPSQCTSFVGTVGTPCSDFQHLGYAGNGISPHPGLSSRLRAMTRRWLSPVPLAVVPFRAKLEPKQKIPGQRGVVAPRGREERPIGGSAEEGQL